MPWCLLCEEDGHNQFDCEGSTDGEDAASEPDSESTAADNPGTDEHDVNTVNATVMDSELIFGFAPPHASQEKNDIVCILAGCTVPVLLRRSGNFYKLVGESFMYGQMDGAAMPDLAEDDLLRKFSDFSLI